jgi:methylglutaconyl-CoA hydratase
MSAAYNTLTSVIENEIATITFNRPEKRNAISYELIQELIAALGEAESSAAQIVILTGAGKAFCSGMDLENLRTITSRSPEENLLDSETMAGLFRAIYEFPKVTIAAVNGPAVAGGCGIATLCDFTIAAKDAKFGYSEVRIGFLPAIVSAFLVRQVGEKQARDLLLTGKIIEATEALRLGMITEVVALEHLMERTHELAEELLQNSPASLAATKRLLNHFSASELGGQIDAAVRANAEIRATADFREGVTSFLEKRKPKWSGR